MPNPKKKKPYDIWKPWGLWKLFWDQAALDIQKKVNPKEYEKEVQK